MRALNPCSCRIEMPGGGRDFLCSHPQVGSSDRRVTTSICRVCEWNGSLPVTDTYPVPSKLRRCSEGEVCLFLGTRRGTNVNEYDCGHPSHRSTTLQQCQGCEDFDYRLPSGMVSSWAVGVTTAPRVVPTLSRMLASLVDAGWSDVWIFAEPGSPRDGLHSGHHWCPRGSKLGAFSNWYLSLTELVLREPEADAYFLCQDDVVFCKGLRDYLERFLWPDPGPQVLSLYCAGLHESAGSRGFRDLEEACGLCGALSLIFPNAVARALLCDPAFFHHRRNGPLQGTASIDSVVGRWCEKSRIPLRVHSPSLCQHIGEESSLWGKVSVSARRSSVSFPGEQFSALEL